MKSRQFHKAVVWTDLAEHITDTGETTPIEQQYYPVSPFIREAFNVQNRLRMRNKLTEVQIQLKYCTATTFTCTNMHWNDNDLEDWFS